MASDYTARDFSGLIGMKGFSEPLLRTHFKLYEGYVKNTNTLLDRFEEARQSGETAAPRYAELRRRFGWEFNGMRLHEVYFGNLEAGGSALEDGSPLAERIQSDFGGFDAWRTEFSGIGGMRGIGWACLFYDPEADRLMNIWINEHDAGQLATGMPILLLDVFEHAYMQDYGTNKSDYMAAFFDNVSWRTASARFERAQEARIPLSRA